MSSSSLTFVTLHLELKFAIKFLVEAPHKILFWDISFFVPAHISTY